MDETEPVVHVKCKIRGKPARAFLELKRRGIISSVSDGVVQGILLLEERVAERDLKIERAYELRVARGLEDER